MPYNNVISRTDAGAVIPVEVSTEIIDNLESRAQGSTALQTFTRVPVSTNQLSFPVVSALPMAYWVNGDTGLKQTSEVNWARKNLVIEELAVIVPIPENVMADADTPIWDQVQPLLEEAFARTLDQAVFFGTNAPASFPPAVITAAAAAGNVSVIGTAPQNKGGIVGDHSDMLGKLEADGYDAGFGVAARSIRGLVRQARNVNGDRFGEIAVSPDAVEIDGVRYSFPMRGLWPTAVSTARAIAFDPTQFVIGLRQDISYKLLTEGVVTDNSNAIIYNLPQQDMVALRATMRVGWQVANTVTWDEPTDGNRYPAAVLNAAAA